MKCLHVITGLTYGGGETQLVRITTQLKLRGWDVRVVSITPPKAYVDELESAGIPVTTLNITRKIPSTKLLRLAQLIRNWQPDVVHSHMVHANILTRLTRLVAKIPVLICTAQNIIEKGQRGSLKLRELFYRITDPLCDITTQVSKAGLKRYIEIKAVPPHKMRYIPNAVDTTKFYPDKTYRSNLRKELELDNYFIWLSVGRLVEAKDYPSLFHAFQKVLRKNRNTRLIIVGDGPLYSTLRNLAIKLEIDQYVLFMGIRDDVPRLMNAADAFVMSSEWEGMPLVLQEAASCALPIVATDVGGNSEVVIDQETGFLVPPKNPEALAQAMLKLMNLPLQQRIAMGIKGRNYMKNVYSLDQIVNQWESLYFELINKKQTKHKANIIKH